MALTRADTRRPPAALFPSVGLRELSSVWPRREAPKLRRPLALGGVAPAPQLHLRPPGGRAGPSQYPQARGRAARPGLSRGSRRGPPRPTPPPSSPGRPRRPRAARRESESREERVRASRPPCRWDRSPAPRHQGTALHPGPGRSLLAGVAKSTYQRERGSPERGVPAAAEATAAGAASCVQRPSPLCGGSGGGLLPPPRSSPTRRRALLGSCSPSAAGGRAPRGPVTWSRKEERRRRAPAEGEPHPCAPGSQPSAWDKIPRRGRRAPLWPYARLSAATLRVIQVRFPPCS